MPKRSVARKPAPPRPIQRRSSGRQTRAEILAAAERHFAERGEAARLEDIAADVGIRRAAIFHYFRDKEELYAARAYPPVLRAVGAVRRGLDSLHLATIDLYRPMEAGMAGGVPFFSRDIHFTVYGNRIVGDALADSLQARGVSFRH